MRMQIKYTFLILIVCIFNGFYLMIVNSQLCESGFVNIRCIWNETKCESRPTPNKGQKNIRLTSVLLYDGQKLIGEHNVSRRLESNSFLVPFNNAALKQVFNFSCVWRTNNVNTSSVEICQRMVYVDTSKIPNPALNLSLSFYNYKSFPSPARALKVTYRFDNANGSNIGRQNFSAVVYRYRYDVKSCPTSKVDVISMEEKASCQYDKGKVSCLGFLKLRTMSGVYAAYGIIENKFGTCRSKLHCQRMGYFDKYGGIKTVRAVNHFPNGLNISWIYPEFLMTIVASSVRYNIKLCWENKCKIIQASRRRTDNRGTFVLIRDGIKHGTNYTVSMQYVISEFWDDEESPWTKSVSVVTLNRIPDVVPSVLECKKQDQNVAVTWIQQQLDTVTHFHMVIQESERNSTRIMVLAKDCSELLCKYVYRKIHKSHATFHIEISACSNGGCTRSNNFNCQLDEMQQLGSENYQTNDLSVGFFVILSIYAFVFLCTSVWCVVNLVLKKRNRPPDLIVTPRIENEDDFPVQPENFVYDQL